MADTERVARRWIEVWGEDDPATLPLAPGFVHESPFGRIEGREKYLEIVKPMAEANVASLHIRDLVADGDRACVAFTMETPGGPVECCDWVTIAGDEIVSVRSYYDTRNLPHFEPY
jgi:hypothetical protein